MQIARSNNAHAQNLACQGCRLRGETTIIDPQQPLHFITHRFHHGASVSLRVCRACAQTAADHLNLPASVLD